MSHIISGAFLVRFDSTLARHRVRPFHELRCSIVGSPFSCVFFRTQKVFLFLCVLVRTVVTRRRMCRNEFSRNQSEHGSSSFVCLIPKRTVFGCYNLCPVTIDRKKEKNYYLYIIVDVRNYALYITNYSRNYIFMTIYIRKK